MRRKVHFTYKGWVGKPGVQVFGRATVEGESPWIEEEMRRLQDRGHRIDRVENVSP